MPLPHSEESEPLEVPPMCDAHLDRATLEQLFMDLAGCTTLDGIQVKNSPRGYAQPPGQSLEQVRQGLLEGSIRAVQVCYRHDGFSWVDTILSLPRGYRLVRCRQAAPSEREPLPLSR